MFHHRVKYMLNVIGIHEITASDIRTRLRHFDDVDSCTRACRQTHRRIHASRLHQRNHVRFKRFVDVNLADIVPGRNHFVRSRYRLERIKRAPIAMRTQNIQFRLRCRIAKRQTNQETVHLRFGQRKHAMEFHGVFCRKHHEQFRERIPFTLQRNLAFFHRFQQCTLRSRRRAVDFVCEQDLRKHRSLADFELARIRLEHGTARHIRREQVRRKLDSRKVRPDGRRKSFCNRRLARSRHILDEHVTICEERHHKHFHLILFPQQNII